MGALKPIPHGVACAVLIGKINRAMVEEAQKDTNIESHNSFLMKMTEIAKGWGLETPLEAVEYIESIVKQAEFKPLKEYGFTADHIIYLSKLSSKRNSPSNTARSNLFIQYSLLYYRVPKKQRK